jgi:hypothetical protein
MSITAHPTLTVAGQLVAAGLTDAGAAALVAVESLRFPWGRSSPLEQPQATTGQLTVLDRSATRSFASRTDLTGQLVTVGWAGSDGSSGTIFRGRITRAAATPRVAGGFAVALSLSSIEVDLANYPQPAGTSWPAETFAARKTRIAGTIPAGLIAGGLNMPGPPDLGLRYAATPSAGMDTLTAAAVDVSGKTVLDLIRQLYASWSPLAPVYDPGADRFTFAPRRLYAWSNIGWTASALAVADADHGGRYVPASLPGIHLNGGLAGGGASAAQAVDSKITRVEVQYSNAGTQATRSWATSDISAESVIGRRTLSVDSIHSTTANADQLASFYADVASVEARAPRLAPVSWSSAREPLHNAAHAAVVLATAEPAAPLFLANTWLPAIGQRPLVAVLGGTVGYAGGDWDCDLNPGPIAINPNPFAWAPITPAACAPTVLARNIDPSFTFGDVAFLDVGIGYTILTAHPYHGNPT